MIPLQLAGYDLHTADIVGSDGSMDALERQFSDGLELDYILDLRPDTLADENLSVPGLAAEAGGEIGNTADCSIIEPPFDSDLPQRRVALGDADPETDPSVVEAPMLL